MEAHKFTEQSHVAVRSAAYKAACTLASKCTLSGRTNVYTRHTNNYRTINSRIMANRYSYDTFHRNSRADNLYIKAKVVQPDFQQQQQSRDPGGSTMHQQLFEKQEKIASNLQYITTKLRAIFTNN